ncbi:hypothetical protein Tco_0950520, partial [Tanacetum coccineum]
RLDVPKFLGVDPERWIFAISEYFSFLNTPVDQRLRIVGFNLEGAVAEWFQWMTKNGALSKLLQLGTVKDYQREFEKLMNRVTNIPDSLLISYISGLQLHLQQELLVSKPTTLGDVFLLARSTEARLDDQAAPVAGMSVGLKANKVVNDDDGEVKVINWVQQVIDVESTSYNDARDQASELETKVLVDGKQDAAKVVKVVVWPMRKTVTSQMCWKVMGLQVFRYMSRSKLSYWLTAKRILRYLKRTIKFGVLYKKCENNIGFVAYTDSNCAGDLDDGRSTSGFVFMMGIPQMRTRRSKAGTVTSFANSERQFRARREVSPAPIHNIYTFYESESSESDTQNVDIETLTLE